MYESEVHFYVSTLHEVYYPSRGSIQTMKSGILVMAIGILLLLALPALVIRPTTATEPAGLYAAFWKSSFFGSPLPSPAYSATGCVSETAWPAGTPSSTPPTATEIDPNIAHGASTGFYWMESPPGSGFSVNGVSFTNVEFSTEWTGYITLPEGTTYFQLTSDDGSQLYINTTPGSSTISASNLVINDADTNPTGYGVGIQPATSATGSVTVSGGSYPIEVDYYQTCDSQSGIDLSWSTSVVSGTFSIIPTTVFTPAQIGSNAPITIPSVPQFGLAAPVIAAFSLLAFALVRKRTFGRIETTA